MWSADDEFIYRARGDVEFLDDVFAFVWFPKRIPEGFGFEVCFYIVFGKTISWNLSVSRAFVFVSFVFFLDDPTFDPLALAHSKHSVSCMACFRKTWCFYGSMEGHIFGRHSLERSSKVDVENGGAKIVIFDLWFHLIAFLALMLL